MAKARCPGCGAGMKAKRRFCGECGRRNPLFPPKDGQAATAARPVLVKPAPAPSVADIRYAQIHRAIREEADPGTRQVHINQLLALMKGRAA